MRFLLSILNPWLLALALLVSGQPLLAQNSPKPKAQPVQKPATGQTAPTTAPGQPVQKQPNAVPGWPAQKQPSGSTTAPKSTVQTPPVTTDTLQSDQIELVQADALEGGKYKGEEVRKLLGNVVFKQKDSYLYCDSAYQYKSRNAIEAFSNVRINQADTVTITGNRLTYNGDTKVAKMTGNVVLKDRKMTLTAPALDYNMDSKQAFYTEGGVIVDAENRLESRFGQYNTVTKIFNFKNNVRLNTKDATIESQALDYNTLNKMAFFNGATRIIGSQGTLVADRGTYDTVRKLSNFTSRARIETADYTLAGNNLVYNEATGYGKAIGNVKLTSLKDNVVITGSVGQYWKSRGLSKVYGNAIMRRPTTNDTLYMAADTLMALDRKSDTIADLTIAYPNVRIFKSDIQGRCDSLSYNSKDSTMYMHYDPILWNNSNQIVANHIRLLMRDKELNRMELYSNAFLTSEDTLRNYNQVKGRDMTAFFRDNKIRKVNVDGNGESIYFALEGDSVLTGMNYTICSNMVIQFDSNKVNTISFLTAPDARFVPPHELLPPDTKLKDFIWRIEERPARTDITADSRPRTPRPKGSKPEDITNDQPDQPAKPETGKEVKTGQQPEKSKRIKSTQKKR